MEVFGGATASSGRNLWIPYPCCVTTPYFLEAFGGAEHWFLLACWVMQFDRWLCLWHALSQQAFAMLPEEHHLDSSRCAPQPAALSSWSTTLAWIDEEVQFLYRCLVSMEQWHDNPIDGESFVSSPWSEFWRRSQLLFWSADCYAMSAGRSGLSTWCQVIVELAVPFFSGSSMASSLKAKTIPILLSVSINTMWW